jgi:hypothetical protein
MKAAFLLQHLPISYPALYKTDGVPLPFGLAHSYQNDVSLHPSL